MAKVIMYTSAYCPYCANAERLLMGRGVTEINKIRIDLEPAQRVEMMQKLVGVRCRRFILMINILAALMTCAR